MDWSYFLAKDLSSNSKSGIFLDSLFDHCPTFFSLGNSAFNNSKAEKVGSRIINENSKEELLNTGRIFGTKIAWKNHLRYFLRKCYEECLFLPRKKKTIKNSPINPHGCAVHC